MESNFKNIEDWPIEKLIPYARNARTHSDKQLGQIAASISEWGFTNPIIADAYGNVIAGHGRLLAAQKLGRTHVPVRIVSDWPDAKKPVAMMERVMLSSLPNGGLCVEPFGGSGSTLIGAERTGRVCYAMELNPIYCDTIVRRWQKISGKKAVNEATGNIYDNERI